nr:uncharacterized protein LOC101882128 isoform X2 [Danio rerio]|eukprot:XP_009295898.1 uncharacterized protein LOC101882128 isoform X2 [Danio rerio]
MAKTGEVPENLSLVCLSDLVHSHPEDDVLLSCCLDPAISAHSMEIKWWHENRLVCHYEDGQMTGNVDYEGGASLSAEDLHTGNVSLILRSITKSQRGLYRCEVIHRWQTISKHIFLQISSVNFSLVLPPKPVSVSTGRDVTLTVRLSPETSAKTMNISWFRGTELIYQFNGKEQPNSAYESRVSLSVLQLRRGNVSLTLKNVQQSDSGRYTCRVLHDGCQITGTVDLEVRGLSSIIAGIPSMSHRIRLKSSIDEDRPMSTRGYPSFLLSCDSGLNNSINGGRPTLSDDGFLGSSDSVSSVSDIRFLQPYHTDEDYLEWQGKRFFRHKRKMGNSTDFIRDISTIPRTPLKNN